MLKSRTLKVQPCGRKEVSPVILKYEIPLTDSAKYRE